MSNSNYTLIQQLLDEQLVTVADLPTLVKENVRKQDEKANTAWCRSTLIPSEPNYTSIGADGLTEWRGLYQISLFYPEGYGVDDVNTMVDTIVDTFPKGLQIGATDPKVMIWKSYRLTAMSENNKFIHVPIRINWSYWS